MKRCGHCGETKPFTEFYTNRHHRGGYDNYCKRCKIASNMESVSRRYEKVKAYQREWNQKNKVHLRLQKRAYLRGITIAEYHAAHSTQQGKCAICGVHESETQHGVLHIDHCHDTMRFRGLLCGPCNRAIGMFKHDVQLLQEAIRYLQP